MEAERGVGPIERQYNYSTRMHGMHDFGRYLLTYCLRENQSSSDASSPELEE